MDELRAEVDAMDETAVETVDVRVARGATRVMVEDMARRRWRVGEGIGEGELKWAIRVLFGGW